MNEKSRLVTETEYKLLKEFKRNYMLIKKVAKLYAESKIGKEDVDGCYSYIAQNGFEYRYDPRPAKQLLQILDKMEEDYAKN